MNRKVINSFEEKCSNIYTEYADTINRHMDLVTAVSFAMQPDDSPCARCKHGYLNHIWVGKVLADKPTECGKHGCTCDQFYRDNLEWVEQEAKARGL